MPVVAVQAAEAERLQRADGADEIVQPGGLDAGAVHAHVDVDEEAERSAAARGLAVERKEAGAVVGERVELRLRVLQHERHEGRGCRADERIGEQDVLGPGLRRHLGLGERRALEAADAHFHLHLEHRAHLVRLHMRPKARRAARDLDRAPRIFADLVGVVDQRGGKDLVFIFNSVLFSLHGMASSQRLPQVYAAGPAVSSRRFSPRVP